MFRIRAWAYSFLELLDLFNNQVSPGIRKRSPGDLDLFWDVDLQLARSPAALSGANHNEPNIPGRGKIHRLRLESARIHTG